jgi:peptide/nickel transport system ATP-binding protein
MSLLAVRDLRVRVGRTRLPAVDGVDLDVPPGTVVGLVGESGSGKSTLARAIVGLVPVHRGRVLLDGHDYRGATGGRLRRLRRRVQLVFQDPRGSLNPRMSVGEALAEALRAAGRAEPGRAARREQVARLLGEVALRPEHAHARPSALSGGQRQRVALARALATGPDLIIADEVTSALDASVQASVLNLLRRLCTRTGMSMLFISHNLPVVRYMSDSIAVMQLGRIVERGPTDAVLSRTVHPYTRVLVDSASMDGFAGGGDRSGELPDPHHPPAGCRFRTLCPVGPVVDPARERCEREDPGRTARSRMHQAACHYAPSQPPTFPATGATATGGLR